MKYTLNRDKNYFITNEFYTNCGSLAFNIEEWYAPDEAFEEDDYDTACCLLEEGMSEEEVRDYLFVRNVEQIQKDFEVVRVNSCDYPLAANEELIAFRECVNGAPGYDDDTLEVDFHFRVKRDGKWIEKLGNTEVINIDSYSEDPWYATEELIYDGPIAYFVRKVS